MALNNSSNYVIHKVNYFSLVCQQNFKDLAPRRNVLAEKLICEKEQKKTFLVQEESNSNEGKNLFI
jgi:hypothetical protein